MKKKSLKALGILMAGIMSLGMPAEEKPAQDLNQLDWDKVHD